MNFALPPTPTRYEWEVKVEPDPVDWDTDMLRIEDIIPNVVDMIFEPSSYVLEMEEQPTEGQTEFVSWDTFECLE